MCSGQFDVFFLNITGTPPSSEEPEADYPLKVTKNNGKTALCVQAFTFTKYLGNLTVTFDNAGDVKDWTGNPIYLDNSVVKGLSQKSC